MKIFKIRNTIKSTGEFNVVEFHAESVKDCVNSFFQRMSLKGFKFQPIKGYEMKGTHIVETLVDGNEVQIEFEEICK